MTSTTVILISRFCLVCCPTCYLGLALCCAQRCARLKAWQFPPLCFDLYWILPCTGFLRHVFCAQIVGDPVARACAMCHASDWRSRTGFRFFGPLWVPTQWRGGFTMHFCPGRWEKPTSGERPCCCCYHCRASRRRSRFRPVE